jgi:hypothetical protein
MYSSGFFVFYTLAVDTQGIVVRFISLRKVYVTRARPFRWKELSQPQLLVRISAYMLVLSLSGCWEKTRMDVELTLGGSVEELLKTSPVEISSDCSDRLGLCFHSFSYPSASKALPTVSVKNGSEILQLENITGLHLVDDTRRINGKIATFVLTLRGVPSRSDISPAKNFAYSTIAKIRDAGWVRYIDPRDPRIPGVEAKNLEDCNVLLGKNVSSHPCFDPGYEMTDQQWSKAESFYYWYFYKNGYYLTFKAWRSRDQAHPPREASYLFTLQFESEEQFWINSFNGDDITRWKELLPPMLIEYKARREAMERQAELAGMTIDRSYQNPPIFALEK